MGDYEYEKMWHGIILGLHESLLAGDTGLRIMGIVALLTVILSITGILLWSGWRKLAAGFKIKWNGQIKRTSFDIHKVAGIIAAVFFVLIGVTGASWNLPQLKVEEAVYAATFTPKSSDPVSQPIPNQKPLPLADLLQRADAAVPNAKTTSIGFADKPEETLTIIKRTAQDTSRHGNTRIYLDRFSGKVLRIDDGMKPSRAKAILNQFVPVHYGTFAGVYSRILYVFVGLSPTILFITGLVMWRYRHHQLVTKTR